jgi:hypothetical protein
VKFDKFEARKEKMEVAVPKKAVYQTRIIHEIKIQKTGWCKICVNFKNFIFVEFRLNFPNFLLVLLFA